MLRRQTRDSGLSAWRLLWDDLPEADQRMLVAAGVLLLVLGGAGSVALVSML